MAATLKNQFTVRWLPIDLLTVDTSYQRHLNDDRVKRIVEDFDVHQLRPLRVVNRESAGHGTESYVVEDGQHALAALMDLGWKQVPAFVRNGRTSLEEEAALFTAMNSNQKALRPLEMFKADVVAKKPKALAIKEIVEGFDLLIVSGVKHGVPAIKALENVYDIVGPEGLTETISMIVSCWGPESDGRLSSSMLKGMSRYLADNPSRNRERDRSKFMRYTPTEILRAAKSNSVGVSTRSVTASVSIELERIVRARLRTL